MNYRRASVLISGAAAEFGSWQARDAEHFLHDLALKVASRRNRIITGFGYGVGGPVINGTLAALDSAGKTISDEDLVMRPFPQTATGLSSLAEQWTNYRKSMIDHAGIAIFVFGNKRQADGTVVLSNGMQEEFDLCIASGVEPLPIGATGFMAEKLWKDVRGDVRRFIPSATDEFIRQLDVLGDPSKTASELVTATLKAVAELQNR